MQAMVKLKELNIVRVFAALVVMEMVLGGTGRLVMIGPISLRILLMGIAAVLAVGCWFQEGKAFGGSHSNVLLLLMVLYFCANLIVSLFVNHKGQAIDVFTGYISILMCLFFARFFSRDDPDWGFYLALFRICLFAVALLSIFLWIYSFRRGLKAYPVIRPILDKYVYGSLSYMGTSEIPRIFLKTSVYMPIGLMLAFNDFLNGKHRIRSIIECAVLFISLITSFTFAFYLAAVVAVLILLIRKKKLGVINGMILLALVVLAVVFVYYSGVYRILLGRLSDDGTVEYKWTQAAQLLKIWAKSPIFGMGFGYSADVYYEGLTMHGVYQFEVMWMQLLLNTGLVGFLMFVGHIWISIKKLRHLYRQTGQETYLILWIAVFYLCLVSFSNPFMNNSIGLLFYALASGIADANDHVTENEAAVLESECT